MVFVPGLCGRGGVTNYRHIFPGFLLGASGFSGASGASAKASVVELAKQSGKKERNGLRNAVRRPLPLKTTLSGVFLQVFLRRSLRSCLYQDEARPSLTSRRMKTKETK